MAHQYFIKRGKKINGPFSVEKLRALKKAKKLKADDEISQSAEGPWESISASYKAKQSSEQPNPSPAKPSSKTVTCEDCGGVVSRRAQSCPHCGAPIGQSEDQVPSAVAEDEDGTYELAVNSPKADTNNPSVVQLDTMTFLVENLTKHEVFGRIKTAASLCHTVHGAFGRSGIIRGEGDSGITFAIAIEDSDDGVVFEIDGETPEGPINFGAWFDPTEAEGWGLFAATELFNVAVNSKAANTVEEDVGLLSFNILNSLQAADLLGLDSETIAALTGMDTANALEYDPENKGTLLIRRLSKTTGVLSKITVFVDGHEKGTLSNGSKLVLSLPVGDTSIELRGGMMKRSKTLTIVAGEKTEAQCYFSALGILGGGLVFKTEDD